MLPIARVRYRRDILQRAHRRVDATEAGDHPPREMGRRQAAACRRDIALREEGLIEHLDPGFLYPRFGFQVGAGRAPSSNPSLASTSVPEHCAPISCRDGSSCNCAINP